MTDQNKETIWITIPDDASPALEAPAKEVKRDASEKVQNKAFWGAGFIALIAFAGILFAPQEFAKLMQGQLFDGSFQVVPDFENQQQSELFGGEGEGEGEAETNTESANQNVVEAESEAVSIQIEPITEAEEFTVEPTDGQADADITADGVPAEGEPVAPTAEAGAEAESINADGTPATETAASETGDEAESLDANAQLLQALSKQLEEFKEKEKRNDQTIQDLMTLLQDQTLGIHGAGTTQVSPSLLPQGQQSGQAFGQFGQFGNQTAGAYRYNTHTVSVSPYDILAQNQGFQQASYQANIAYQGVTAYSNQAYNPVLAGVQGQPDSGPAESFLFALALASFGILVWGSMRAIRIGMA